MLIDRPVEIGPLTGDLQIGLVGKPPVTASVAARPGRLDELGGEPLDPPVDSDVIDGDSALGQQLPGVPGRTGQSAGTSGPRPRSPPAGTGNQQRPRPCQAQSPDQS